MRKMLSLFLALMMVLTIAPTMASAETAPAANQLIVGSTTDISGDLFTTMWGNNAMDAAIKGLIHGYATVFYSKESGYIIDPTVVEDFTTEVAENGDKTYTFKIAEDLTYNDGTKITAKDYVFTWLLTCSPVTESVGATLATATETMGYEAYRAGEASLFSGVRLVDEYTFSVTILAEFLPYFYELALVATSPYPYTVIAPGCDIADDGEGAYITGEFTSELLQQTMVDPAVGYRYNPKVTSGPYQFVEFNKESLQAVVKINPLYKGNYTGQKPSIETIIMKKVTQATMMSELEAGQVDLLFQVTGGNEIIEGQDLADRGVAEYNMFLRNGFGFFTFACEAGTPTYFAEVRRAIAYCIDVPEFARQFTKGFGQVVYGYYGAAQWMAKQYKEDLAEKLNTYALSLENAKAELEAGGWVLNEKGEPFVEGTDTLRYKEVDGQLMACKIKWASSVDNAVSDLIAQMLPENMRAVGMDIEQDTMQFAELLEYYYQPNTEEIPDGRHGYQMYNLATNFTAVFDPYYYYHTDPRYLGVDNTSGLMDEQLTDLAFKMRNLNGDQTEEFGEYWFQWQQRWNELLPTVPLYSNEYFDFYNPKLKGYEADSMWNWYYAILYATIEE